MVTAKLEDLSKASKEVPTGALALFVAMHMFEEAREDLLPNVRVYWGSTKKAVLTLFPTRNMDLANATADKVKPWLRVNGFDNTVLPNDKGGGWKVPSVAPDASNWTEPISHAPEVTGSARTKRESAEAQEMSKVLAGDVRHKWQCRFAGCGERFTSQRSRGIHESARKHLQVVQGKTVTGAQFILLHAVLERPWEHPRWYSEHLKVTTESISALASELHDQGLITKVGSRVSVRYGPANAVPEDEKLYHRHPSGNGTAAHAADAAVAEAPNPVGLTVDTLLETSGDSTDWRDTAKYLSPEAAEAVIAQVDQRVATLEQLLAQAESLQAEVAGLKVALNALRKPA